MVNIQPDVDKDVVFNNDEINSAQIEHSRQASSNGDEDGKEQSRIEKRTRVVLEVNVAPK
jgi:hypothetical protein